MQGAGVQSLVRELRSHMVQPKKKKVFQFSRSVISDCLQPHGLQHARLPCPSPTHRASQTHVHWVGDAIQPSHRLCPLLLLPSVLPSIRVFSSESASWHQMAKVLELQLQHQSFQWIFRTDFLYFILNGRTLKELSSKMTIPCSSWSKKEEGAKGI